MDNQLEEKRSLYEERDRIEMAIVNEMLSKKNGHRDKLDSEHRQKALLDRYMKCSANLLKLCETDDQRTCMPAADVSPSEMFNEFQSAIRDIKEYWSKQASEQAVTIANEFEEIEVARLMALGIKPKAEAKGYKARGSNKGSDDEYEDDASEPDQEAEMKRLARGLPTTDLVEVVDSVAPVVQNPIREHLVEFTDEEGYGRYFDLNKCHEAFLQVLKHEEHKPNYMKFLEIFDQFTDLSRERKLASTYKTYVESMLEYFRDFSRRAKPLFDFTDLEKKAHEKFLEQWDAKTFPGWFTDSDRQNAANSESMIDLDSYRSAQELMGLGLDCLKSELQVRGLKCGGTLEDRAKRLFSVRGKRSHEIDPNIRAGPMITQTKGKKKKAGIEPIYIASIEAKLATYADYYADIRMATIENVQRKQARTAEERNDSDLDDDHDDSDLDSDDSDNNDVIYNPKNLPLGWDGKPIPYWLYKLHGLNLTYTCEICGNTTYKGPKAFQRHFAEWRHAHGMKSLGIPNTAHFANITKMQEAVTLWQKLQSEREKSKFQPDKEEEYEDSQGNVVNKKTYEDLLRQGLL